MMNGNQKWIEQTKSVTKTKRAKLVFWLWITFISTPITIIWGAGMGIISLAIFFSILLLFPFWQPAYTIMYLISGSKDVSPILEKLELKGQQYLALSIRIILLLLLFYSGIKSIMEKGICGLNSIC